MTAKLGNSFIPAGNPRKADNSCLINDPKKQDDSEQNKNKERTIKAPGGLKPHLLQILLDFTGSLTDIDTIEAT